MRIVLSVFFAALTFGLCYVLNTDKLLPAPLGKLLSPQSGVWQNAESVDCNFSDDLHFSQLQGKADVYFDERLVPHIFADYENDAYFIQGYLHAKFRLWQMELQVLSASGRASEVVGDIALNHDREFRRLGMVYAAENSLKEMEKDQETKSACDAYTAGVNEYINGLTESTLPLEYKLLNYKPESWTNLKSALFLKYMSYDLSAHENDFELTNAKSFFNKTDFDILFPQVQDSLDPIIPRGTVFAEPKVNPVKPAIADSLYLNFINEDSIVSTIENEKPEPGNGSNNWAVSGKKTKSGAPILCNDPHLGLNLPSLWFEIQISVPEFNAYGVSFPGAPGVIIGFNDNCAFGFTNGGRDVRDYYEVKFKNASKKEYWFNGKWEKTTLKIEDIAIKGKPAIKDTVAYTIFGPVMYDASFNGKRNSSDKSYAVRWTAHNKSNELKLFYLLDRAKNYEDYLAAVKYLKTPGQNCVFACKNGDIAMRAEGNFPAKWNRQGDFVMPGFDSSFMWQAMIPEDETPFQYNPERGYVSSANQRPVDSSYPYYLGYDYPLTRGLILNKKLSGMSNITPENMMALQTSNYNIFAKMAVPLLINNAQVTNLNNDEILFYYKMKEWDFKNDYNSVGATVFELVWKHFKESVYKDEYASAPENTMQPFESTLLEMILKDSAYKFLDDISTPQKETLIDAVTSAFRNATIDLKKAEAEKRLIWGKYKDTHVDHLLKLPSLSRLHLPIGGGSNVLNATKENHGPSWRMVVSLTKNTEAYGVYPGGQSGNPGSRFYDGGIDVWSKSYYYRLWMMKKDQVNDNRIKWKIHFES